jgi:hypothetical protein
MRAIRIGVAGFLVLATVGVATYLAGEQTEVAVLRSFDQQGVPHETKLWIVDHAGVAWVRVANPRRQWYRRLVENPRAELVRHGATQPVRATPVEGAHEREAVERRFREKYGVVDWWYGLLLRRDAVPIRLDPQ